MMIEFIGWLGAFLLATCGLPQLVKTIRTRNFDGLSLIFLFWWLFGEILILFYVMQKAFRWPLILNYGINIVIIFIILFLFALTKQKNKLEIDYGIISR